MTDPGRPVWDVAVVGAGPAGLAAAAAAAEAGSRVVLIDAAARPGGQFWRSGEIADPALHHGWRRFQDVQQRVARAAVTLRPAHTVHTIGVDEGPVGNGPHGNGPLGNGRDDAGAVTLSCAVGAEPRAAATLVTVRARRVVLATGAYDRQLPFAGWDLPGVLTAGGAQALLKGYGVAAGRRAVVAGTGPFLLAVATGLLAAGVEVAAVVEANDPAGFARHPRAVLAAAPKLGEAAGYAARLARTRTPYLRRHVVLCATGDNAVDGVEVAPLGRDGRPRPDAARHLRCDVLAVGWGFAAQLDLPLQAGCATAVGADGSLVVAVDERQRTSVARVWAAGESTGIGGADLAIVEGEIAGRAAAGAAVPPRLLARRARWRRFAAALHAVHPIPQALIDDLADDVLVCRCEEVDAGQVRHAVRDLGATDARTVKLLTRPGMGWCQGRVCGTGVAALTAATCGRAVEPADLRAFAERPFTVPLPLRTLLPGDR